MFIARWIVEIRFGKKSAFLDMLRQMQKEVHPEFGIDPKQVRFVNASIGAPESRFEEEIRLGSLQELEQFWSRVGQSKAYAAMVDGLAEVIIPGSNRWEVYREVEV